MLNGTPRTRSQARSGTVHFPKAGFQTGPHPCQQHSLLDDLLALLETGEDIARVSRFCLPTFLVSHPDGVRHVLRDNAGNYRKGAFFRSIALLQGQGLLTSEGEIWHRQRRVAQPAFSQDGYGAAYGLVMAEEAQGIVSDWQGFARSRKPINVVAWMHRLTFRIAARAYFGIRSRSGCLGRQLRRSVVGLGVSCNRYGRLATCQVDSCGNASRVSARHSRLSCNCAAVDR